MKRVRRVLSGAAAALMLGGAVQALEPALDPLPDLSAYPTQLLVDGQAVEEGAVPRYFGKTVLLPLCSILEQAGYTVAWDARAEGAAFSRGSPATPQAMKRNVPTGGVMAPICMTTTMMTP